MLEKINTILQDFMNDKSISVNNDTMITSELGLNSYQFAELICVLEDEFEIEIPDHVIGSFVTVKDIIDFVNENK